VENKNTWYKNRLRAIVDCIESERDLLLLLRFARALVWDEVQRHG